MLRLYELAVKQSISLLARELRGAAFATGYVAVTVTESGGDVGGGGSSLWLLRLLLLAGSPTDDAPDESSPGLGGPSPWFDAATALGTGTSAGGGAGGASPARPGDYDDKDALAFEVDT